MDVPRDLWNNDKKGIPMNAAPTAERRLEDLRKCRVEELQQTLDGIEQAQRGRRTKLLWTMKEVFVFKDIYVDVDREIDVLTNSTRRLPCKYNFLAYKKKKDAANAIILFFLPGENTCSYGILSTNGTVCYQVSPFRLVHWIMPSVGSQDDLSKGIELLDRISHGARKMLV